MILLLAIKYCIKMEGPLKAATAEGLPSLNIFNDSNNNY